MVPLPLFKLAALFVKHISKYGANRIKAQAHDHPHFRALAARYGQAIHQLNMRMQVTLLRDPDMIRRAKERAEAPTVKTQEQTRRDDEALAKAKASGTSTTSTTSTANTTHTANTANKTTTARAIPSSIWRRKFRPLPEAKAVDLFADVVGDTFILGVAVALIVWEYWRSSQKPDANLQRIEELRGRVEELQRREGEREEERERQRLRLEQVEGTLSALRDKTKGPLIPLLQRAS